MTIKFQKFAVVNTATQVKARVRYYIAERNNEKLVQITEKDYGRNLPKVFDDVDGIGYRNDTDTMTDYFCHGEVVIAPGHALYPAALERAEAELAAWQKKYA